MPTQPKQVRRWTLYACDDCSGVDNSPIAFDDRGWFCAVGKPDHGTVKRIGVLEAEPLLTQLHALVEEWEKRADTERNKTPDDRQQDWPTLNICARDLEALLSTLDPNQGET